MQVRVLHSHSREAGDSLHRYAFVNFRRGRRRPASAGLLLDVASYTRCVAVHVGPNPSPNVCNNVLSGTIASAV